jgi:hypothetical protein
MPLRKLWLNDSKDFSLWYMQYKLWYVLDHELRHIMWVPHVSNPLDVMCHEYRNQEIISPTSWPILKANYPNFI